MEGRVTRRVLGAGVAVAPTATVQPGVADRVRVARRSRNVIDAMAKLDADHSVGHADLTEALAALAAEFEVPGASTPLGIVAFCRLGGSYEVHTLDPSGSIVEHYKTGESLPPPLDRGRHLARHEAYAWIEVYVTGLACVRPDGSVVFLEGNNG